MLTEFQGLVTGFIAGALMRPDGLDIEVDVLRDAEGNYLPEIRVRSRQGGERVIVCVRVEEA